MSTGKSDVSVCDATLPQTAIDKFGPWPLATTIGTSPSDQPIIGDDADPTIKEERRTVPFLT